MSMLVFDEETGDFIDAANSSDTSESDTAPMPVDDVNSGGDSDWVVYTSEDTDTGANSDLSAPADTSLSIDWDAEAGEVNDLLPPPPPGRSGMKHGQGAIAP